MREIYVDGDWYYSGRERELVCVGGEIYIYIYVCIHIKKKDFEID